MPTVIDAGKLIQQKKRLPCEAFFVDTNILIDSQDVFGYSLESKKIANSSEEINTAFQFLKSKGHSSFSTPITAAEYFKYVQNGYYVVHTGEKKFNLSDFKTKREDDTSFMVGWDLQLKKYKRLFTKSHPLYIPTTFSEDIIDSFLGSSVDFGDHLLIESLKNAPNTHQCIFSNDFDFLSFEHDFFLLTFNKKIIETAQKMSIVD